MAAFLDNQVLKKKQEAKLVNVEKDQYAAIIKKSVDDYKKVGD